MLSSRKVKTSRISGLAWVSHLAVGRALFQQFGTQVWLDADPLQSHQFRCEANNLPLDFKTVDSYNRTLSSVVDRTRAVSNVKRFCS